MIRAGDIIEDARYPGDALGLATGRQFANDMGEYNFFTEVDWFVAPLHLRSDVMRLAICTSEARVVGHIDE